VKDRRFVVEWVAVPPGHTLVTFLRDYLNHPTFAGHRLHSWQIAPSLDGPGAVFVWEREEVTP
jgi:hypothetical protein